MDSPANKSLVWRAPIVTFGILAAAIIVWLLPGARDWFIYDRQAILHGELWRIFTGQLVHCSLAHLFYDAAAIALTGFALENQQRWRFLALCCVAPWVIGVGLMVVESDMRFYAGLSALATCFVVVLAMDWWKAGGGWRIIGALAVGATAAKLFFETKAAQPIFIGLEPHVVASRFAHIIGACTGLMWSLDLGRSREIIQAKNAAAPELNQ